MHEWKFLIGWDLAADQVSLKVNGVPHENLISQVTQL